MFTPDADSEILKKASYAAYDEAIKDAFRTLSASIVGYPLNIARSMITKL